MKFQKRLLFTVSIFASCWMLGTSAAAVGASTTGRVTTNSSPLTVRSSASTSGKKLGSLPRGSTVSLTYRTGDWWYVEYANDRYGFVHADYITVSGQEQNTTAQTGRISLTVPDFKQYDSRWANTLMGNSGQTMKRIGCTTAALADTESYRTGKTITPAQMEKRLSYTAGGAVYWPEHYQSASPSDYLSVILRNLKAGKPTIVGAKDGLGKAHWVVVTGYDGKGSLRASDFIVNDPGSGSKTRLSQLFSEHPNFYKLEYY